MPNAADTGVKRVEFSALQWELLSVLIAVMCTGMGCSTSPELARKNTSPILQYVWGHVFPFPKSFIRKLTLFYLFVSAGVLHTMALQHLESVWEGPAEALVLSHPLAALAD